ncbi:MAG: aminotransferase class I/II-fold pyridoxal phosphate-dependent enzyme [Bacteroidia bacterium]|nr:aminotransferase class I/II-fold pyridoxal phosphate-dependent enzyme [Bacteroidia bacterium]
MKLSYLAENIIGSEIIRIAGEINKKIKEGEKIYNLTIGDFDPKIFPIPSELKEEIIKAYHSELTNYPPADGLLSLREAVTDLIRRRLNLNYDPDEVVIAGGARPIIYSIFRAIVDKDDKVLYAVPSWNNNHYTFLNFAQGVEIQTSPENNFMPTANDIAPYIKDISLLALCSPQNPTGTVFSESQLSEICMAVLEENKRRGPGQKPLYVMYDQIYWELTYNGIKHVNPVSLYPEMKQYTVFVDGISKSLAATGVRVGWSMGPRHLIDKMKAILTHVGAWAPKPEQEATAVYLSKEKSYQSFLENRKKEIFDRLNALYLGFRELKEAGYPVECIQPQAAIYLTVRFSLKGMATPEGAVIKTTEDITRFLLNKAKLGIVPFYAFGSNKESEWYRISVGTIRTSDIPGIIENLKIVLEGLKTPMKNSV